MPVLTMTRRTLATAATAWALGSVRPAAAAPGHYQFETDVWTGSVLVDAEGHSFTLNELRQPLTLLKLWAGWCPACAAEIPQLTAAASSLGKSVEVILISHPQYWVADQAMARRRQLPYRLATFAPSNPAPMVEQALLGPGHTYSVPKTFAFRARDSSIVMKRETSTDWSSAAVLNQVKSLLG